MRIVYAPRALRDIDEILAYIRQRSPRGAHAVSLAIEHTIQLCALSPHASGKTDEPNVYRRRLGKYRYTIFYRALVHKGVVEIVRVIHSSRVRSLDKLPDDA